MVDEIRKYLLEASFAANDDSELPEVSDVSKILVRGEGVVHQDVQLGQVLQTVGGLKDLEDGGVQLFVVVQGLGGLVVDDAGLKILGDQVDFLQLVETEEGELGVDEVVDCFRTCGRDDLLDGNFL